MKGTLCTLALLTLLSLSANASTSSQPVAVYTFICTTQGFQGEGPCPQGGRPGTLILGSDGNFYGAAQDTSEGSSTPSGGTVFSVTPAGKFTLLHSFPAGANKNYPTGNLPGSLRQGPDGKLYGDTLYGGIDGCNGYCGFGVLYRVNTNGTGFQLIHKLCSQTNCRDGYGVYGKMVLGTDGNLYGTSSGGGTSASCVDGCGTIFRITPSTGAYKVVFSFDYRTTGDTPSGLVVGSDGTFYGIAFNTTGELLFHYNEATGALTTTVLNFPLFNGLPASGSGLTIGPNGNFYGLYGIYGQSGEGVFEVDTDGSNLTLFPFYTTQNGAGTPDGLFLATDGTFWMADFNGATGYGDIIQLSPTDGSLMQTLTPFGATAPVGSYPAGIFQDSSGVFWGSTYGGGNASHGHFADGTVWNLNEGLPPR